MGLSGMHVFLIVVVVLVFFGPSRLPGLGKSMGEAIRGFKEGMDGEEIDVTQNSRRESLQSPQGEHTAQSQKSKSTNEV